MAIDLDDFAFGTVTRVPESSSELSDYLNRQLLPYVKGLQQQIIDLEEKLQQKDPELLMKS